MRRTRKALWLLLVSQLLPLILIVLGASGALDPLGKAIVQSIPLPAPGERAGFLINAVRFFTAYWFIACIWLEPVAALVAVLYVAFDDALTKAERITWAVGFIFGQSVTVILYCVLGLLAFRKQHHVQPAA